MVRRVKTLQMTSEKLTNLIRDLCLCGVIALVILAFAYDAMSAAYRHGYESGYTASSNAWCATLAVWPNTKTLTREGCQSGR